MDDNGTSNPQSDQSSKSFRCESDSLGEVLVPESALFGAQTQRAVENFTIGLQKLPIRFIQSLAMIKSACATANCQLGVLEPSIAKAINQASSEIYLNTASDFFDTQFPVHVYQTGSGTSTNMNMNEVLSTLARRNCVSVVHPNDHVNKSQSSNDTIPTAIHVSSVLAINEKLIPALNALSDAIQSREEEAERLVKTGRTHLMDAVPLTVAQEISAWREQVIINVARVRDCEKRLLQLPQGGTAIGTGLNAPTGFSESFCNALTELTGYAFTPQSNFFAGIAAQDTAVELSGQLNTIAVTLMKIANDLRWMNSGPLSGLGEISLKALQPGSSIMPGKINPVIPEAVAMAMSQIMGNHTAITIAGQSGSFQLNVMLPLIANNLLSNIDLISDSAKALSATIRTLTFNETQLKKALALNPILVTALNQVIGYDQAALIAKTAYEQQKPILEVAKSMTDIDEATLEKLLNPAHLTKGGLPDKP